MPYRMGQITEGRTPCLLYKMEEGILRKAEAKCDAPDDEPDVDDRSEWSGGE